MREMLDLEDSSTAGETVLGHHPHNMAAHLPFTGRPQENGFDEMAPLQVSSGSVSKLYCDLIIKCCERDAVNSLGCCAAKFVNNSFTSTGMERFLVSASKLEAARRLFWEPLDSRKIIYAQSNWSLAVLRLMLETPTTIIPVSIIVVIYYGPVFRWVAEGKGRYMNAFVYRVLRKSRGVHQLFRNSLMNGYEVKNKDLRRLQ